MLAISCTCNGGWLGSPYEPDTTVLPSQDNPGWDRASRVLYLLLAPPPDFPLYLVHQETFSGHSIKSSHTHHYTHTHITSAISLYFFPNIYKKLHCYSIIALFHYDFFSPDHNLCDMIFSIFFTHWYLWHYLAVTGIKWFVERMHEKWELVAAYKKLMDSKGKKRSRFNFKHWLELMSQFSSSHFGLTGCFLMLLTLMGCRVPIS